MRRRGPRADPAWVYSQLLALHPQASGGPLCVAFSGGEDSTALLGLLAALPQVQPRLRAVHIDHGLHAASGSWARHCRATCRALHVPLTIRRLVLEPTRGYSTEALAREARYAALAGLLRPGEVLLSAHHLEDQLETVLLQLLRGAGLPGLAAMPAVAPLGAGFLVRPLLGVARAPLRAWVRERGLACLEDPSNADAGFDRNYLRHEVLPAIIDRWPGAAATVARSARHIAAAQGLLDGLARADVARAADGAGLSVAALRALPLERRRNALRFWIARRASSAAGRGVPDARRLEEIAVSLLAARAGANPFVSWGGRRVQRHGGRLLLDETRAVASGYEVNWDLKRTRRLTLPQGAGRLELVRSAHGLIDAAALPAQVTVRTRRGGERLRPRAGGPSRTLKSLLQSEAISLTERQNLPLLFAGDHLAAAADLWVDARWQPLAEPARRMRLIWHRPA
ncbi:MAG TPA: tRNA lysidine(34) synthetase TilS [Steroidobacteraceae bacterium]|nr:tRNA lysidine(34) synthetase TilS [Steroidobacteraceae bacterium]